MDGGHVNVSCEAKIAEIAEDLFRTVIGHFATGVTIITTVSEGDYFGTTANAMTSVSTEPPTLLICLNRSSDTQMAIQKSRRFVVNILSDSQRDLALAFAQKGANKFSSQEIAHTPASMPALPGSLALLDCVVTETAPGGTHVVFLAQVVHAEIGEGSPLTYYRGKMGSFSAPSGF